MSATEKRVAWEVEIADLRCIVFSTTKPKAQWIAVRSYREAYGQRRGVWPRANARRVPYLDTSYLASDPPQAFIYDYVRDTV